jgi:hypothetical protein
MSALAFAVAWRNQRADVIRAALDGGAGPGRLFIFAGVRPSLGGAVGTQLALLSFSDPCAPSAVAGTLTFSPIAPVTADATGTAAWARATDSAGNLVFDCDVGADGSGAPITLDNLNLILGGAVTITSAVFTEGNAS